MSLIIRSVFDASSGDDSGVDFRKKNPKTGVLEFVPGRTKQSDSEACDINFILARYSKTGVLPEMIRDDARYGDFSDVPSFQRSLEVVAKAEEQFAALDASVRARFNHDPAQMLKFCANPKNGAEMVKLGLAIERPRRAVVEPEGGKETDRAPGKTKEAVKAPESK